MAAVTAITSLVSTLKKRADKPFLPRTDICFHSLGKVREQKGWSWKGLSFPG